MIDTAAARGHHFERSVEGNQPVLRCTFSDCGHIWWPDQSRPSRPCQSQLVTP